MNDNHSHRGPGWGALLLIPAALIVAKGVRRRRAMWAGAWDGSGPTGRGPGHHARFGHDTEASGRQGQFRLPPRLESMLDAWHTHAHEETDTPNAPDAAPTTI